MYKYYGGNFIKSKLFLVSIILLILVSLTCVSAADENQAADIVTQDSEIIANESIMNYEYDGGNDVLADPMGPTSFRELASEIGSDGFDGYYELDRDFEFDAGLDSSYVNGIYINIDNLIIDGKGHRIDADCKAKIFDFHGQNVTMRNINFVNGNSTDGGAIVNFAGGGIIVNCTFTNCFLNGEGSLVKSDDPLTVKSSNFTDNNVKGSGMISSGIFIKLTVEDCLFEDNVGRAVYAQGPLTVIDSTFNRNNENNGGALYLADKGTIKGSVFNGNSAENGGAICLDYGLVEIDNCVFNGNTAYKGGAIFMQSVYVTLNVNNTIFSDNEARDGTNNIASGRGKVNLNNVTPEDLSPFAGVDFKYLEYNQNLIYGEDLIIEFIISCTEPDISVLGGNLSIAINGKNYNTTVTSNDVKLNISDDFPVGDYSANLTYSHKEHQLKKVQLITFHVSTGDDDPNLDIIIDNVGQDKPATVQITTNPTFSGNVEVIIDNDANYTVAVTNGEGSIEISGLSRGDHTAKAIFPAWDSFRYSEKTVSFRILKNDPGLSFYFDNWIHPGETSRLRISMNDAIYDGTVYVYFNGTLRRTLTDIYEGKVLAIPAINTYDFPVGDYPIRVVYSGNDDFESSEKTDTLKIVRIENRFSDLNELLKNSEQKVTLDLDYIFDPEFDSELTDGIDMIYHDLEIDGQGHTIDAKGLARFFTFNDPIVLKNIVFANGIGSGSAEGVIKSMEDATLENCTFINNSGNQGVVHFMKGATVKDSSFTDGYVVVSGGALYFEQGGLVENCNFTNNTARHRGGAIYSNSGILTVTGSRFTNNHAGMGGAIVTKGDIIVNSTVFADNVATDLADNIALYKDATISVSDVDPEDLGVLKDVKIALAEDAFLET